MNNTTTFQSITPKDGQSLRISILIFIMVSTIFGNVLVCTAIILDRRLRSLTNAFIASLSVSDLLYGSLALPLNILHTLGILSTFGIEMCRFYVWLDMFLAEASMANLALISVDRYLKITDPFSYQRKMTRVRARCAIAFIWIFSATAASFALVPWPPESTGIIIFQNGCLNLNKYYYVVVIILGFLVPLLILIVMYSKVYRIALSKFRKLKLERTVTAIFRNNDSNKQQCVSKIAKFRQRGSTASDFKATRTVAMVICCFTFCWTPFFIIMITLQFCLRCVNDLPPDVHKAIFLIFITTLPSLNSACNPVIYALFNREFRESFRRILFKLCAKYGNSDIRSGPRRSSRSLVQGLQSGVKSGQTQTVCSLTTSPANIRKV